MAPTIKDLIKDRVNAGILEVDSAVSSFILQVTSSIRTLIPEIDFGANIFVDILECPPKVNNPIIRVSIGTKIANVSTHIDMLEIQSKPSPDYAKAATPKALAQLKSCMAENDFYLGQDNRYITDINWLAQ